MAASDALDGEPCTLAGAMERDGFERVLRAGRLKAAGPAENRGEQQAIGVHAQKQGARSKTGIAAHASGEDLVMADWIRRQSVCSSAEKVAPATELRG